MDDTARSAYHRLVASLFWDSLAIRDIAESAGLRMDMINWSTRAYSVWQDVLDEAARCNCFDTLHRAIKDKLGAQDVRQQLDELCALMARSAAGPGQANWYSAPLPQLARLVGPEGRRAVFDRVDLRSYLDSMDNGLTALFVDGQSGEGRSYSWQLLQHVAMARGHRSVWIDIKRRWGPAPAPACTARDLMSVIVAQLMIPLELSTTSTTQPDTEPRILADKLIGAWPPPRLPAGGRVWIMIDGLDYGNITTWAVELVEQLLSAADESEFPGIQPQFLVTGYSEPMAQAMISVAREQLQAIGRPDIEQFFRDTASHLGQPVDEAFIASLADRAYLGLPEAPDLTILNRNAADLARQVLARAG